MRSDTHRRHLEELIACIEDGVLLVDRDGFVVLANEAASTIFGVAPGDLLRPIAEYPPLFRMRAPGGGAPAVAEALRALAGEHVAAAERCIVRPSGAERLLRIRARPLHDEAGQVESAMVVVRDITGAADDRSDVSGRRAIDPSHQRGDGWSMDALRQIPHGLVVADAPGGRVIFANLRARELLGFDATTLTGLHDYAALPFYYPNGIRCPAQDSPLARALVRGEIVRGEELHFRRNAGIAVFMVSAAPLFDGGGRVSRAVLAFDDVTDRRKGERERTQLLESERAARAEAQAATRAKDEFLAVLSHELRTPLQSMLGWVQMLRTRKLDERTIARGLETIERATKTQAQLIEDLLDISRIVAGKIRLDIRPVKLAMIVDSAVESVKAAADIKEIRVDSHVQNPGEALGDPDRLQQIMVNLLSNAVKFTPRGGRVEVRLERADGQAQIVVADNGKGIASEFLPYIFERFRQADSTSKRAHGGLGLGLTIVRHMVELHGGVVRALSEGEGRGATFVVTLPLLDASVSERPPDPGAAEATTPRPFSLYGIRALLVDDDADTCELLSTVLRESGANVRAVSSAREAVAMLEPFSPDILISDIGMPDEDGYQLIRSVRAIERNGRGRIPAIALTAYASHADRQLAFSAGFQAHIAKPVRPVDLTKTVARLVGRSN